MSQEEQAMAAHRDDAHTKCVYHSAQDVDNIPMVGWGGYNYNHYSRFYFISISISIYT